MNNRSFVCLMVFVLHALIVNSTDSLNNTLTSVFDVDNICDNSSEICITTSESLTTDFVNFTEDPLIDKTSVNGTTKSFTTLKTTPLPTTVKPEPKRQELTDHCNCDLTSQKCDINCCCDPDCDENDRLVFSHCYSDLFKPVQHSGLCFSQQFIYKNNTRYNIVKEEKGLFCIAKDNFPDRLLFKNQKVITSLERFAKVWKRKTQYTWPSYIKSPPEQFQNSQNYKFGSLIWTYDDVAGDLKTLEFPIPLISKFCSSTRPVRYLTDFKVECLQKSIHDGNICDTRSNFNAQNYCDQFKLIGKPTQFNLSNIEESANAYAEIRKTICDKTDVCVEVAKLPSPSHNRTLNICQNVIKNVNLIFFHNGSHGIVEAECVVYVQDVPLDQPFSQTFHISFFWARNETNVFHRSGTPGYLAGKPLISGKRVIVKNDKLNKELTIVSKDPKDWITFPKGDSNGDCDDKINLCFGENTQSQCSIRFKKNLLYNDAHCSNLYEKIWNMVMGDIKLNESDSQQFNLVVASYGDPVPENQDDWVPVYLENPNIDYSNKKSPCKTILNGIKYKILYSYFGPFSNPQIKIIGVTARLTSNRIVCVDDDCRLKIITTVNYIDVSLQAINKFAKAPVVKIKLPQDFFYPFSSSSTKTYMSKLIFVVIVLQLVLIL